MKPNLSLLEVSRILSTYWNLEGKLLELGGYEDQNFQLKLSDKNKYVVKISSIETNNSILEAQNNILTKLKNTIPEYNFPYPIKSLDGDELVGFQVDNTNYNIRILNWVDGIVWNELDKYSSELYSGIGKYTATLNKVLLNQRPGRFRHDILWDIKNYKKAFSYKELIEDNELLNILTFYYDKHTSNLKMYEDKLRMSVIHNDINNYNIIVNKKDDSIAGIIDFGDMVYSHLINELAIIVAYAIIDCDNIEKTFTTISQSYHKTLPLLKEETLMLYSTIGIRLSMSILISTFHRANSAYNEALFISENDSIKSLHEWYKFDHSGQNCNLLSILK